MTYCDEKQHNFLKHEEIMARKAEKESSLLRMLRDEKYTHQNVAQLLWEHKTRQAANKTLNKMKIAGLIKKHEIDIGVGRKLSLWGITNHGIGMSWSESETPYKTSAFEPSKISIMQIHHRIGLQTIRVAFEREGWLWQGEQWKEKNLKAPDGIIQKQGDCIAIEYERTFKSLKRYEKIIGDHLQAIKRGIYQKVIYVMPSKREEVQMQRIFCSFSNIRINGKEYHLSKEHINVFEFKNIEELLC